MPRAITFPSITKLTAPVKNMPGCWQFYFSWSVKLKSGPDWCPYESIKGTWLAEAQFPSLWIRGPGSTSWQAPRLCAHQLRSLAESLVSRARRESCLQPQWASLEMWSPWGESSQAVVPRTLSSIPVHPLPLVTRAQGSWSLSRHDAFVWSHMRATMFFVFWNWN